MIYETGSQTLTEMEVKIALAMHQPYDSALSFLNAHRGWRPGNIHTLLGSTSSGKSTLVRTLIMDALAAEMKVLLWLSEEKIETLKTELAFFRQPSKKLENLIIVSEQDGAGEGGFLQDISKKIDEVQPDLFILDNLTTSRHYGPKRPGEQDSICYALKKIIAEKGCASLLVCHTASNVTASNRRLIAETDVRGSRTIANISEFFYTLQKLNLTDSTIRSFLRIIKHRGQEVKNTIYEFEYNSEARMLANDKVLDYQKLELWLKRSI